MQKIIPGVIFALLLLIIAFTSMRQKNVTFDECDHLPAGYSYVAFGDFRLNPEHPPLVKALAGLPLRFMKAKAKADTNDPTWKNRQEWDFGLKFLYEWNDADRMLFWGRAPMVLLSLLIGLGIYCCAWELYGAKAGYAALALYLFSPDVLAHGQLVTTDLPVAGFLFIAVYTFYRALNRMTPWRVSLTGLAASCALISKFSGVLVFPMFALVGAVFIFTQTPITLALSRAESMHRKLSSLGSKCAAVAALIAATAVMGLVIIWAAYGFRYSVSPGPESSALNWQQFSTQPGIVVDTLQFVHSAHLLPEAYTYGFLFALKSSVQRKAFLLGERSETGWWYYFPITFLIKTPIPFLLLIALGFFCWRQYGAGLTAELMLLLPVGLYWLVVLSTNLNIGHRHLLPIYPFLIVFASKVARVFDALQPRWLAVACGVLLAWNALETVFIYPHFLSYFNEIAGGPSNGYRWLVDSNLDWGQDLKGLVKYEREHPDEQLFLSYFGNGSPEYYGLKARMLPSTPMGKREYARFNQVPSGAMVAVSATNLQCLYLTNREIPGIEQFMQRLRNLQPVANIGHSILIYRMP